MPSLPQSTHNGSYAARATGSSIPSVHLHCPHCHCACLGKLVPMLSQGHPTVCLSWSVTYRPCRGSSGRPFGAMLFLFPPTTRVGPLRPLPLVVAVVPPLPPSPSLRYPAFRFRSLCSLHLHSGRSRSSPSESRRGSLDAPRRVSPSLTLRASRPPSESSSSLFCLVFSCWFRCVIRCLIGPCGSWLRFRIR